MNAKTGTALVAGLVLSGMFLAPTAVMADTQAGDSPAKEVRTIDSKDAPAGAELTDALRALADRLQAEVARDAADAVSMATKLDLDIRLAGPTLVAGAF